MTRPLIATLVAVTVLASAATSQAQVNARSLFNQVAKSYSGNSGNSGNTFQIRRSNQNVVKQVQNVTRHINGGHRGGNHGGGHVTLPFPPTHPPRCQPKPPCHGGGIILPPPPPPVCYIYIVYYYDCNYGWREYRTFHNQYEADSAVYMLQSQGYRAYLKKVAR